MTASAAVLEDPARWIGLLIAVAGAISANPDATAHAWHSFWERMRRARDTTRGFLARFIPFLRRNVNIHAHGASGGTAIGTVTVTGRALVGWGEHSTVEERIQVLDDRTRVLHSEVGELQKSLSKAEQKLRQELNQAIADLRQEAKQIEHAIDALRSEILHSDASALPVIVVGLVLTGLASDAASVPLWVGLLVFLGVVAFAGQRIFRIWRDWTSWQEHQSKGE